MVHAKNYETVPTFVKVYRIKNCGLFFPDTVYISHISFSPAREEKRRGRAATTRQDITTHFSFR